jgi:type VI secretion system protein ImpF
VRRDLEWLLNTRRIYLTVPDDYPELQRSVYHYGVPDITSLGRDAPATRARLASHLEEAIALFEPRLSNVAITVPERREGDPSEQGAEARGQLHFRIQALLAMDPEPLRIAFDTVVDRTSGGVAIQSGES